MSHDFTRRRTLGAEQTWQLTLNDERKIAVARFHQRSYGVVGKSHKASLEIYPQGEAIVDEILTTFVYVETRRDEREKAAMSGA